MKFIAQPIVSCIFCAALLTACSNDADGLVQAYIQSTGARGNVSDTETTNHVKAALSNAPGLEGLHIAVVTTKGDVRLTGAVTSQAQMATVISTARAAEGAHSIYNELTLP
jgi:hyperosmotically inducible periplasmic protein